MSGLAEFALFTDDVVGDAAFYRGLLREEPVADWPRGALFAVGDGISSCTGVRPGSTTGRPQEDGLALSADDLDAACTTLVERGFAFLVEAREYSSGRSACVRDPEDRLVELVPA